jgi:Trp operon repressor
MPWRNVKVAEQRMEFVIAVSRKEHSFKELCEEFKISRRMVTRGGTDLRTMEWAG